MYSLGNQEIRDGTKEQNQQTDTAGFIVEKGAGGKQKQIAQKQFIVQEAKDSENQSKEGPKIKLGKQERRFRVERQKFQNSTHAASFSNIVDNRA